MQSEPPGADEDRDLPAPALEALAAAILDGTPIDWRNTSHDSDPGILDQLHVLADLAALHRSLTPEPGGAPGPANELAPVQGVRWGPLTLQERIGHGAFGEVFRAWDSRLQRDVAVKLLFRDRGDHDHPDFLREGRLLARVRHPNVVTVHGAERLDGRVGLITEFVDGRTLAELVRAEGPLPLAEAIAVGLDLCRALHAVHEAGLLHRDIKPQNVMRQRDGRVVLMDFGAGHHGDGVGAALAGTPLFLAPEVLEGRPATIQSDIYSVGVLLHYLLTGGHPVTGTSLSDIRQSHQAGRRLRLRTAQPALPAKLTEIVDRCTDPDPDPRYQSAASVGYALETAAQPGRRSFNAPAAWIATAAILLVAAAAGFVLFRTGRLLGTRPQVTPPAAAAQRVTVPPYFSFGGPSRDGRYFAYVDPKQNVWIQQVASGQTVQLTQDGRPGVGAEFAVASWDGSQVAIAWRTPDASSELRVATNDDRWPATALRPSPPVTILRTAPKADIDPVEWSKDGNTILALIYREDGAVEITLVEAAGSSTRLLQSFRAARPRRVSLSPDARYVVYDLPALPSPQRDIFILSTAEPHQPALLLGGESNDELPVWNADGTHVLFTSDRGGVPRLWSVEVNAGHPRGLATPLRPLDGAARPSVTDAGDYYYELQTQREQIYEVPLDARGIGSGLPVVIPRQGSESNRYPVWSHDGGLAYVVNRGMNLFDHGGFVRLLDVKSSAMRDIRPALAMFGGAPIDLSPDGASVLMRGRGLDNHWGYFTVDVGSGRTTAVLRIQELDDESRLGSSVQWDETGRNILYARTGAGIISRAVGTNLERVVIPTRPGEYVTGFGLSPDGRRLAFAVSSAGPPVQSTLRLLQPDGRVETLHALRDGEVSVFFRGWNRDGTGVLYSVQSRTGKARFYSAPVTGGPPMDINLVLEARDLRAGGRLAISPDGRTAVFSLGRTRFELWRMEGVGR